MEDSEDSFPLDELAAPSLNIWRTLPQAFLGQECFYEAQRILEYFIWAENSFSFP